MTSRQESKVNMYRSVQQLCDDNNGIIAANTAFVDALTAFSKKVAAILDTASSEVQVITGITIDKSVAKKNLCQTAADVAAIIFAFASTGANNQLRQVVNFSFSDLNRQKDDLLVPVCTNIVNAANDNAAALLPFGLTPAMITALETAMDDYAIAVPRPKTAKSVKRTFTNNLKQLVKEADAILKDQMDKMTSTFKATDPDFVSSYKYARVIIDPKQGKKITPTLKANIAA